MTSPPPPHDTPPPHASRPPHASPPQATPSPHITPEPQTTVVEFGPEPASSRSAGEGRGGAGLWQDPRLAWVPAGLGAAGLFGSLVGEWQVVSGPSEMVAQLPNEAGVAALNGFGAGWVLGGMLLASCVGLALVGQPPLRPYLRTGGLVLATVMAGVLVATTMQLDQPLAYRNVGLVAEEVAWEMSLGRGLYLAYATLALFALALWLARRPSPQTAPPASPAPPAGPEAATDPGQLTVGPAEPFLHPTKDHEWR